jgi:hypothetical protein
LDTVLSSGKLAVDRVLVNFYVMAKHNGPGMSQESVQTVAKLLKAILTNPATIYDLGLKGVRMLSPQTPQVIQGADYAQRLVACGAQMLYPIRYGDQPVDQGGVTWSTAAVLSNLNVVFNQSNALVVNGYLMNFYAWTATVTLYSASLIADAPQTSPVVMELEINGALTGQTIAIPMGDVDTEVTAMSVLNVAVPAGNQVRWKVISAPAPTDSAWYVSLVMTVGLPSN